MDEARKNLSAALWRIYRRPDKPIPWTEGGNLPWDNPDFSKRMLREHLDESHSAASRKKADRDRQIEWIWEKLDLNPDSQVLDVTCGPGLYSVELASRGCRITGVDFGPAAVTYARDLAERRGLSEQCQFIELDVRRMKFPEKSFDAALFIYGQLSVFTPAEAAHLLKTIAHSLRPGGRLVVELLDQQGIDKGDSNWWYMDDKGLWGDKPYLHLGERFWLEEEATSIERFYILHLDSGEFDQVTLCDQSYATTTMVKMMKAAGFSSVDVYPAWGGLLLNNVEKWVTFVATR